MGFPLNNRPLLGLAPYNWGEAFQSSVADREEGLGRLAEDHKQVLTAQGKQHMQEVAIAGSMLVNRKVQLRIGKNIRVGLQIPPSPNDDLTTPRREKGKWFDRY